MNGRKRGKMNRQKTGKISLTVLIFLSFAIIYFLSAITIAINSGSSGAANLTIWDGSEGSDRYTYCGQYCGEKIKSSFVLWNIYFNANYTNSSANMINSSNGNGTCAVRFNETGAWTNWENMSYNATSFLWDYNRSFNYKGGLNFSVNCTSSYGNITISDSITITNTEPYIIKTAAGYIDFNGDGVKDTLQCAEDVICYYNFSANVSEDDSNDILTFGYGSTTNTTLTNFTINSTTGMLEINITRNAETGSKKMELTVHDTESPPKSGILEVNITAANDAPVFANLQNRTLNASEMFEYIVNVIDEENNIPFVLNITFLNCSTAQWSSRNNTNCTLFNSSQYSFDSTSGVLNISFMPSRNDVGSYIINFSVMDNSSLGNKTISQIVNFTVLNVNSAPYFTYVCNNERNATEDSEFICWINATDIDETKNLTFSANYSWFTFNNANNSVSVNWSISSDYNFSAMVNFTPTDIAVGNWSINISLLDIGSGIGSPKRNSTAFWFFINNIEDSVSLQGIADYTIYLNETIYVNATDNDLLVTQKSIKNEVLTFASNTSWVNISTFFAPSGANYRTAKIMIDYDTARSIGAGSYAIKVNVTDTAGNSAERNFTITIQNDTAVDWNISAVFIIYEHNSTYFNFSQNVTDEEGDNITFSFTSSTSFPSFSINSSIGIINFTPVDEDVGYHNVIINASDGKLDSLRSFNFTVYNINDAPLIETSTFDVINATHAGLNVNTTEDNGTEITFWVRDDDFKIPDAQKGFYNESLRVNLTIQGPNSSLFEFVIDSGWNPPIGNRTKYDATFTPHKSDIGSYNITINVTDLNNASTILQFNLTITGINHAPEIMSLTNHSSAVNRNFYYRINATDTEDGSSATAGNTNLTFSYNFTYGNNIFNSSIFNSTTGEINITFNSSQGGSYHIDINVNDTAGRTDSADFWLFVYGYSSISSPLSSYAFNLFENITSNLTFQVNHSVGDNLTYLFYINDNNASILRYNLSYYGNATNLTWQFTPNFTEETYGGVKNLTLIVYPSTIQLENRTNLNTTRSWNISISHKNSPLSFSGTIGGSDSTISGGSPQEVTLSEYFFDIDASDSAYNQTIGFTYLLLNSSGGEITVSITNWTNGTTPKITFSASSTGTANYSIIAYEHNESNSSQIINNVTSNNFSVEITISTTPTPTPQSSGGGGGSTVITKPALLKIILPEPVSAYQKDKIKVPIILYNEGKVTLYNITLASLIAKNMKIRKDVKISFDRPSLPFLLEGQKENVTLFIDISTNETGLYEITINASVREPKYDDWGKLYLTVKETNRTDVEELILFTEEFIAENPECIEIQELLNEAREYFKEGNYERAIEKSREAIDACRYAIAQPALPMSKEKFTDKLYKYLSISFLFVIILCIFYYTYRRIRLKRG